MANKQDNRYFYTLFENLPNELFIEILSYLNAIDAFIAFFNLNYRFQCLIFEYCHSFDFTKINKTKFDIIFQYHNTPKFTVDFKHDYGVDTSFGYSGDLLSLKQNHTLLAFKAYGMDLGAAGAVGGISSLLDIFPTVIDLLNLPALSRPRIAIVIALEEKEIENRNQYILF